MIVEEHIPGPSTLVHRHRSEDDPNACAEWVLVHDTGEIKGLMSTGEDPAGTARDFGVWVQRQKGKLKLTYVKQSIRKFMERFGFKEMNR